MRRRPRLAVLLACHNRHDKTTACLASLLAQTDAAELHIFVYDDASTDGTTAAVRAICPAATILPGSGSAYWAGGMRAAFDLALTRDFDGYLWLNDDVVLDAGAVARLLDVQDKANRDERGPLLVGGAVRDPSTGAFTYGGVARRPSAWSPLRFVPVAPDPKRPRHVDTLNGNVVYVPRTTAQAIGGIGPAFVHTLGDLDYGLRVRKAGGTVLLAPGTLGTCARNPGGLGFFDPATPLRARWRLIGDPLGFPLRPWLHFARAHGGRFWPVFAAAPLLRLFTPANVARGRASLRKRLHAA